MPNLTTLLLRQVPKPNSFLILFCLTIGLANVEQAQATTPQYLAQASTTTNAPADLKNLLTQIDAAASQGNAKGVLQFYGTNFTHGDGLNLQTMEKALISLWKRYPQLKYNTEVQSWKSEGNAIVADTVTNITGLPSPNSNNLAMKATITSRQRIVGGKIVRQDIVSERTQLTSGTKPPQIELKLPTQVKVGQQYNFDAIVQEPLGEDYLLGAAIEEPIQANKYLNATPVELELLTSGGLFKEGRAPATPGSQWVSAVIMRGDGMTMVTQRMQIVSK